MEDFDFLGGLSSSDALDLSDTSESEEFPFFNPSAYPKLLCRRFLQHSFD